MVLGPLSETSSPSIRIDLSIPSTKRFCAKWASLRDPRRLGSGHYVLKNIGEIDGWSGWDCATTCPGRV